ncbi:MAG TPA: MaoC family dehydratase [Rhizomicrobium sp.]|nr:MaoC family dehydratase [Rhizomicrobium sp.]
MSNKLLHFEDFAVGRKFVGGPYRVTKDEIFEFAREFDPQPHHLDEEAAKQSMLGGLSASGWQVSAIAMRLFADAVILKTANLGGPGCDDGRWMKPVRPGDVLMFETEVLSVKAPASRPEFGFVKFVWRLFNQRGQVAEFVVTTMPARRGA